MSELRRYEKKKKRQAVDDRVRLRIELEAQNLFRDETLRRKRMSRGKRVIVTLAVILLLLTLASLTVVPYGLSTYLQGSILWNGAHYEVTLSTCRDVIMTRVGQLMDYITTGGSRTVSFILFTHIVVILAGMAMAACGAAYQGVFQNPMASATTMGVQSGGMIAGILYVFFFSESTSLAYAVSSRYASAYTDTVTIIRGSELIALWRQFSVWALCGRQLCTLAGCFLGVALIVGVALAVGRGRVNTVALLLAGSVFSTVINQIAQLFQYLASINESDAAKAELIGSILAGRFSASDYSWYQALFMGVPVLLCLVLLFSMGGKLNIMVFGADEAQAMGVDVTRFRNGVIAVCTILSAVVLSFCGQIAMLDFMIPHFARYLVGPDFRLLLPASALLGAITTVLVYDVSYMMAATSRFNLYTGVVCGVMSIVFILLFRRNRHADWA